MKEARKPEKYTVTFLPDNRKVAVNRGTDVFKAAAMAGIELKSACGNEGTCGRCGIKILQGQAKIGQGNISARFKRLGYVLACRTFVESDLVVEIPEETRISRHEVLLDRLEKGEVLVEQELDALTKYPFDPVSWKQGVAMEPPSLTENNTDLTRLMLALKSQGMSQNPVISLHALRQLPFAVREGSWSVTTVMANMGEYREIIGIEPGLRNKPSYGLAIDIGTTTVVVLLVNLETGTTVDRRGTYNKQFQFGDDVISRIIHADENVNGLEQLQAAVIDTVNGLVDDMLKHQRLRPEDVHSVVAAGNTTMTHLFLGIPPKYIRLEPYIPAASNFPPIKAKELGLRAHPEAPVYCFPAVASYVGGDIVAGVLATDIANSSDVSLFIDIGTNGEIVLGNQDWMVACACSAGPAFEGSGITCGMRAMPGAIQRVEIGPGGFDVSLSVIGGANPVGICGTGLVDSLAKLLEAGVIDRTGKFQATDSPRFRLADEGPEFVLASAEETGTNRDVVIAESDIKNVLRAKAAIYAGIRSLLQAVELTVDAIDKVYIAGGFGNYLNIRDAIKIGLLPDIPLERYAFVGNTSIKGAKLGLTSMEAYQEALELSKKITYIELSVGNNFMEEFTSAMFLPHTNLELFPSVVKEGVR